MRLNVDRTLKEEDMVSSWNKDEIHLKLAEAKIKANQESPDVNQSLTLEQFKLKKFLSFCQKMYKEDNEERETGEDKYWVLTAIKICADSHLPLPDWVATAYSEAYDKIKNAEAKSWDSVFGHPYPKGAHLSALRKRVENAMPVWKEVNSKLKKQPDTAIDEYLFEIVGKKFGVGKTLASEYYYFMENARKVDVF